VLGPILCDLAAGHVAAWIRPRDHEDGAGGPGESAPWPWPGPAVQLIEAADGSTCAVTLLSATPFAEQLARIADQVQEWAVEVLWTAAEPAVWPHCPDHPDAHPLHAQVQHWTDGPRHEDAAVWVCPRSGRTVCAIGDLADVVVSAEGDAGGAASGNAASGNAASGGTASAGVRCAASPRADR